MHILTTQDLPPLLRQIPDPPRRLYSRGAPLRGDMPHVALVGTRLPSDYGIKMAYTLAKAVAEAGAVVVSGLAFGVDALAHKAAVDLGRPTVAILASGVEQVTPSSHIGLARKILLAGGTLLSEYDHYDSAHKYRFLERNRLISGLCHATIVIEAKEKSGALITARHAFDQNRDVYALVGDIDRPQARGCLDLILKDMAKPLVSKEQMLRDLGLDLLQQRLELLDRHERDVLNYLKKRPMTPQELLEESTLEPAELNAALTTLEIQGFIERGARGAFRPKSR